MRWTIVTSPVGELKLATDGTALTSLLFAHEPDPRGERVDVCAGNGADEPVLGQAAEELAEYFAGTRTAFDVPIALAGSDFERAVWNELLAVPYGSTATYTEIATRVGQPKAARAVGLANSLNPIAIIVPCHRVVGSSFTGYRAGLDVKAKLLELEARGSGLKKGAADGLGDDLRDALGDDLEDGLMDGLADVLGDGLVNGGRVTEFKAA